ncbi:MAG TPA: GAF domain-containing protein [Terriglobales bacterium]|nr:GAF domain-containing protein [Terriglobales bacterium]
MATSDIPGELSKLDEISTPEVACTAIARLFHVQPGEVALLRLEKAMLKFIHPPVLSAAGTIPLSSPAVAARTAATRTAMLSNNFVKVRHMTIFEGVKSRTPENSEATEPVPIQKIISVPVLDEQGKVLGVIQLSRKGLSTSSAGPDFTSGDLRQLEQAATLLSKKAFML